jgi:hypothetical protein
MIRPRIATLVRINLFSVKRILSLFCLALGLHARCFALPVHLDRATEVARQAVLADAASPLAFVRVQGSYTYADARGPLLHVIAFAGGRCVIVPSTDALPPILGMFEQPRPLRGLPDGLRWLLAEYATYSFTARAQVASPAIARKWALLESGAGHAQSAAAAPAPLPPVVAPLLTTTWDQTCNYNGNCPADGGGYCGRTLTGCGATALAQVMKFFAYPDTGYGSHSYTPSGYPLQSANYGATAYNWAAMPNSISSANAEIARLMHHCGIAVEMMYSPSNSTSYFSDADNALRAYFRYSLSTRGHSKILYSDPAWDALIRGELDLGYPLLFNGGAHIWVLDGYQISPSSLYHMNWGWGGTYNGWFALSNLNPGSLTFSNTGVVAGIRPAGAFECAGDSLHFNVSGFTYAFELISDSAWTAVSSVPWATLSTASGGKGYFRIDVTAPANPLYAPRYGHVAVQRGAYRDTVWLRQDPRVGYLSLFPSVVAEGYGGGTRAITVSCDSNWVVFSSSPWISYAPASGIGNGSITMTTAANPGAARTGFMELRRGANRDSVIVNQDPSGTLWCVPTVGVPTAVGATQVHLKSIHRSSPASEGYLLATDSTRLYLDSTYTAYISFSGSVAPAIWLDFNQDGDFFDAGEAIIPPSGSWYPTFGGTKFIAFTVPSGATPGMTRLRILVKSFPGPASGPCSGTSIGDIEDYNVWLMPNTPLAANQLSLSQTPDSRPWLEWVLGADQAAQSYTVERALSKGYESVAQLAGDAQRWQASSSGSYRVGATLPDGQQVWSNPVDVLVRSAIDFRIFPNPAQRHTDLSLALTGVDGPAQVWVHDAAGRQMAVVEVLRQDVIRIATTDFPAGVYVLTLVVDGQRHSQRLVLR